MVLIVFLFYKVFSLFVFLQSVLIVAFFYKIFSLGFFYKVFSMFFLNSLLILFFFNTKCSHCFGKGPSLSWSYGSWIYNYLYAISAYHHWSCEFEPLSWRDVLDTTLCDKAYQRLVTGRWFSPLSSTNKTYLHNKTEILLKVAL
jgi:hypothetical protein